MGNIADRAMLVRLHRSQWSGFKYDEQLSREVAQRHGAKDGTARVNKRLVEKHELQPVNNAFNRLYSWHIERTMPWLDSGERVLSSDMYFDYGEEYRAKREDALAEVENFLAIYPDIVANAPNRMGGMLKPSDYPPVDVIRQKFGITLAFLPMPVDDIRVDGLSEDELRKINEQKEQEIERALAETTKDLWKRIYDVVARVEDRLSVYEVDADGKANTRLYSSVVDNVVELCDLLPKMNFTRDETLDQMAEVMRNSLARYSIDELKADEQKRNVIENNARQILDVMSIYTGVGAADADDAEADDAEEESAEWVA